MDYRQDMIDIYLDYVNNYITLDAFAESYNLTLRQAIHVINLGKSFHKENS